MEIPTDQLIKALLGDDMRAADIRTAAMYYEMALSKQKRGDRHGFKIAKRSIESYVEHWPSAQMFFDDLESRANKNSIEPSCQDVVQIDRLIIREQA